MTIQFNSTPYLASVKDEESFRFEKVIFDYAHDNAQFSYGNADYTRFTGHYGDREVSFGKRLLALPLTLWETVKSIYALFKLIILGAWNIVTGPVSNWDNVKILTYEFARSFQKIFGNACFAFNPRYGDYHLQEAEFHLTCYESFATDDSLFRNLFGALRYNTFDQGRKNNPSLLSYKQLDYREQTRLIEEFNLEEIYLSLCGQELSLHDLVKDTDDQLLELLSILDLHYQDDNPILAFAIMSKDQFSALTANEIGAVTEKMFLTNKPSYRVYRTPEIGRNYDRENYLSKKLWPYILKRVEINQPEPLAHGTIDSDSPIAGTLMYLKGATPEQLIQTVPQLNALLFPILEDEWLKGTRLSDLSKEQIAKLFVKEGHLKLFEIDDAINASNEKKLPLLAYSEMTEDYLPKLDLHALNTEHFAQIFLEWWQNDTGGGTRFRCTDFIQSLPSSEILTLWNEDKFDHSFFNDFKGVFSPKQLQELKIADLNVSTSWKLFLRLPEDEFAHFDADEVWKAIQNKKVIDRDFHKISAVQLSKIDLMQLSPEEIYQIFDERPNMIPYIHGLSDPVLTALLEAGKFARLSTDGLFSEHQKGLFPKESA